MTVCSWMVFTITGTGSGGTTVSTVSITGFSTTTGTSRSTRRVSTGGGPIIGGLGGKATGTQTSGGGLGFGCGGSAGATATF